MTTTKQTYRNVLAESTHFFGHFVSWNQNIFSKQFTLERKKEYDFPIWKTRIVITALYILLLITLMIVLSPLTLWMVWQLDPVIGDNALYIITAVLAAISYPISEYGMNPLIFMIILWTGLVRRKRHENV